MLPEKRRHVITADVRVPYSRDENMNIPYVAFSFLTEQ